MPSTIEVRSLASSAIQSFKVPALDRLHLVLELAACAALAFLGLERDLELGEPIPEHRVEPARHRVLTGGIYPDPVIQRFRMADHVVVGDDDARRARLQPPGPGPRGFSRRTVPRRSCSGRHPAA